MERKYFPTDSELQVIRENYDGTTLKINKILRILNANGPKYPRYYVRRVAAENGWAKTKPVRWTEKEIECLLEFYPKRGFLALQRRLKKVNGGISRSRTAIVLKARRLHINKRTDGLTMRMLCELLGADHHKIERWLNLDLLKGTRKGTDRIQVQGGDMWHFELKNIRDFIINNPEEIDIRRVEPLNFIHLVAGMM